MRTFPVARALAALAVIAVGVAILPGSLAGASATTDDFPSARATIKNASGTTLGTVVIQSIGNGKLAIAGQLSGLTEGFHGFHIHAIGTCTPPDFVSAGGHLNPAGVSHGDHAGDMPSLLVSRDGRTRQVIETDAVTLANIFDADGSAIVVHALPDNFANIPTRYSAGGVPGPDAATLATGDSGGRVACGVVTR